MRGLDRQALKCEENVFLLLTDAGPAARRRSALFVTKPAASVAERQQQGRAEVELAVDGR